MIVFPKKTQKFLTKFQHHVTSGRHNNAMITIAGNSLPNDPFTGCIVCIFTIRINSKSSHWTVYFVHETYQIFGNVQCPILSKPSMPLCCLADWHGKKADLNWKLKISNTADNADIIQSQARDTRRRWMQEVNSLCTDSGLLRAVYCIVSIPHNTAI